MRCPIFEIKQIYMKFYASLSDVCHSVYPTALSAERCVNVLGFTVYERLLKNRRAVMYNACACRQKIVVKVPSTAAAAEAGVSEY